MQNYVQKADVVDLIAPYNVASGAGAKVGSVFGVAMSTLTSGQSGPFVRQGACDLTAETSQAWSQGDKLYWDDTNKWVSNAEADGMFIGHALAAKGSSAAVGRVVLVPDAGFGGQAAITALTDSSTGVSGGNTVPAVTNPDLSAWDGAHDPTSAQATAINAAVTSLKNDVATLAAKLNAVISVLHAVGITG